MNTFTKFLSALILALVCQVSNSYATLSGTYTIDSTKAVSSSNYKNFQSAASDLMSGTRPDGGTANGSGISGPVTFNVADGTYYGHIKISSIKGSSPVNTITFQSASRDSSKVILNFIGSYTFNDGYGFSLEGCKYIILKQMTFQCLTDYPSCNGVQILDGSVYISIVNCQFILPVYNNSTIVPNGQGIYMYPTDTGLLLKSNYIKRGENGIYIYGVAATIPGVIIENNIIDSSDYATDISDLLSPKIIGNTITNSIRGDIEIFDCDSNVQILNNKIFSSTKAWVVVGHCSGGKMRGLFANNMIIDGGIYVASVSNFDFVYNSVKTSSVSTSKSGAFSSDGTSSGLNLYNNAFFIVGPNIQAPSAISNSDYNSWQSATWNSNLYYNSSSVYAVYGKEKNSINSVITSVTQTDLHTFDTTLYHSGTPLAYVTTDIDGNQRDSKNPCIGASEYSIPNYDLVEKGFTNLASTICDGDTSNIYYNLRNIGLSAIDSVKLTFLVNNKIISSLYYKINLNPKTTGQIQIKMPPHNLPHGSSILSLKAFTSLPNGQNDGNPKNDTAFTSQNFSLGGTYTIGATNSDFPSFTSAIKALSSLGMCKSVVFKVADGTYIEKMITFSSINGLSGSNSLTFESTSLDSSKVILDDTLISDSYLLSIQKISNITFKSITFTRSKGGNVTVISNANNLMFTNDVLSSTGNFATLVAISGSNISKFIFKNYHFINALTAITVSPSTKSYDSNMVVINNIFDNTSTAISIFQVYNINILGNKINNKHPSKNGSQYGIQLYSCYSPILVKDNFINLVNTSGNAFGISASSCVGTKIAKSLIADNIVSIIGGPNNTSESGITISADTFCDLVYNTIQIDSTNDSLAYPLYYTDNNSRNVRIINNDFVNRLGKSALKISGAISITDTFDYNNIIADSGLVIFNNKHYSTLSSYQTVSGYDKHSVSLKPTFVSPYDLHGTTFVLEGLAKPLSFVTDDIDGIARDPQTPDIGADEHTAQNDIAVTNVLLSKKVICINDSLQLKAIIKNTGTNSQNNFKIVTSITGATSKSITNNITNALNRRAIDTIVIGKPLHFSTSGTYKILVNNALSGDQNALNDSTSITVVVNPLPKPSFTYTDACVNSSLSFNNTSTGTDNGVKYNWNFGDAGNSTQKDPTHSYASSNAFKVALTVTNSTGCSDTISSRVTPYPLPGVGFTFSVDPGHNVVSFTNTSTNGNTYAWDFGDGGTSTTTNPSHTFNVTSNSNIDVTLKVTSANGCTNSITKTITLNKASVEISDNSNINLSVFPNPFSSDINIEYELNQAKHLSITLYNIQGKAEKEILNQSQTAGKYNLVFNAKETDLKPGIYYLSISYGNNSEIKKLVYLK